MPPSAAGGAGLADSRGVFRLAIKLALCFCGQTQRVLPAGEWLGPSGWDFFERRHRHDLFGIRLAGQDMVGLVADCSALAADKRVPVVVFDLPPWAAVDDGLVSLKARSLFALERCDGDAAELDAPQRFPGPRVILVE